MIKIPLTRSMASFRRGSRDTGYNLPKPVDSILPVCSFLSITWPKC